MDLANVDGQMVGEKEARRPGVNCSFFSFNRPKRFIQRVSRATVFLIDQVAKKRCPNF